MFKKQLFVLLIVFLISNINAEPEDSCLECRASVNAYKIILKTGPVKNLLINTIYSACEFFGLCDNLGNLGYNSTVSTIMSILTDPETKQNVTLEMEKIICNQTIGLQGLLYKQCTKAVDKNYDNIVSIINSYLINNQDMIINKLCNNDDNNLICNSTALAIYNLFLNVDSKNFCQKYTDCGSDQNDIVENVISDCATSECTSSNDFDVLMYVSRWPGSEQTSSVPYYVNTFQIHGLWPTSNSGAYPCDCTNTPFSSSAINTIASQLKTVWYDFEDDSSSDGLWTHEWEKHGTCATTGDIKGVTDELSFFNLGITLHSQLDISKALNNSSIFPSNTKSYTEDAIYNAIKDEFTNIPLIQCENKDGKTVLLRVAFCYTKDLVRTNCEDCIVQSWDEKCPSSGIYIPPVQFS